MNDVSKRNYNINNDLTSIILRYIQEENISIKQKYILEDIYEILKNPTADSLNELNNINIEYVPIPHEVLYFLILNGYFVEQFIIKTIDNMSYYFEKWPDIPYTISEREEFITKYLEFYDMKNFRIYLRYIKDEWLYRKIEQKMFKRNDYIFFSIDDSGILKEFKEMYDVVKNSICFSNINYPKFISNINDKDKVNEYLKKGTTEFMLDCLTDKYFGDFSNNVLINLENIVNFNKKAKVVPKSRIEVYEKILNFENLSIVERKKLYFSLTTKYAEYLYEDFRNCRNTQIDMLNNVFIDLNKMNYVIKDGVKVYELKGEYFCIPVHVTRVLRKSCENPIREVEENDTVSFSVIDPNNLYTHRDMLDYVTIGLNRLEADKIMHVCITNSFSNKREKSIKYSNMLLTPNDLMRNTHKYYDGNYNEILMIEDETIITSYLVCYDGVSDYDINLAKNMNLSIVTIYTEFYKQNERSFIKQKRIKEYVYNGELLELEMR